MITWLISSARASSSIEKFVEKVSKNPWCRDHIFTVLVKIKFIVLVKIVNGNFVPLQDFVNVVGSKY